LRCVENNIADIIAVNNSAIITADQIPSSPNISGNNNTAPPKNISDRISDIKADNNPLQTAVKNAEHHMLIPQKR